MIPLHDHFSQHSITYGVNVRPSPAQVCKYTATQGSTASSRWDFGRSVSPYLVIEQGFADGFVRSGNRGGRSGWLGISHCAVTQLYRSAVFVSVDTDDLQDARQKEW